MPDDPPAFLTSRRPTPIPVAASRLFRSKSARSPMRDGSFDPPAFLPPRTPSTSSRKPNKKLQRRASSDSAHWPTKARIEPEPILSRTQSSSSRRTPSFRSPSARVSSEGSFSRASSLREQSGLARRSSLDTLHEIDRSPVLRATDDELPGLPHAPLAAIRRPVLEKHSSLRHMTRPSDENLEGVYSPLGVVTTSSSDRGSPSKKSRPKSHPQSSSYLGGEGDKHPNPDRASLPVLPDAWPLPPMMLEQAESQGLGSRPPIRQRPSFTDVSSLDHVLNYRQARNSWKRESSVYPRSQANSIQGEQHELDVLPLAEDQADPPPAAGFRDRVAVQQHATLSTGQDSRFRHQAVEVGFCFTIAMTQFLAEYLISGFAVVLPTLFSDHSTDTGLTGMFWPAALLSLILSATLLVWARISDLYGGYIPFMLGLFWLTIWTVVPGFFPSGVLLDISRAMQGLSIAAFTPSTFVMVSGIYEDSTRKNHVLGLYGACAPMGFYAGFLVGGALPDGCSHWYFWIAAALAFITLITAYLSVPADKVDRKKLNLSMDWLGASLITSGLILVAYALAVEPYVNVSDSSRSGFAFPGVYAPLACGVACLVAAAWVETRYAVCPLVPREVFRPQGVKWFCTACMFFYAAYGAWLYNSAEFFANPLVAPDDIKGIMLSLWYTPMAIGGVVFCVVGSRLVESVPVKIVLAVSGLAWIGSSLVFAVGSLPLDYWREVMPSMICSTIGLDLTFTVSTIFLSRVQPVHYQGVAGAVSSILINLAMSFSLPISSIVKSTASARVADDTLDSTPDADVWGFRAAFIYATASATIGLVICLFFVKISRSVMKPQARPVDEEIPSDRGVTSSEAPTLVDD